MNQINRLKTFKIMICGAMWEKILAILKNL